MSKLVSDDQTVSSIDALALIDKFVTPTAHVEALDLQGNTISLRLTNISLSGVGKLVSTLYEQPIVANVSVSTAGTEKAEDTDNTASMVITLKKA